MTTYEHGQAKSGDGAGISECTYGSVTDGCTDMVSVGMVVGHSLQDAQAANVPGMCTARN